MFELMDKKIIAILRKLFLLNWPYGEFCLVISAKLRPNKGNLKVSRIKFCPLPNSNLSVFILCTFDVILNFNVLNTGLHPAVKDKWQYLILVQRKQALNLHVIFLFSIFSIKQCLIVLYISSAHHTPMIRIGLSLGVISFYRLILEKYFLKNHL